MRIFDAQKYFRSRKKQLLKNPDREILLLPTLIVHIPLPSAFLRPGCGLAIMEQSGYHPAQ